MLTRTRARTLTLALALALAQALALALPLLQVREMSEAQGIKGFIENLLGEVSEEHVMISNPYPYPYPYPYSR